MAGLPPSDSGEHESARRLHRCIRDLAALSALPSMCIERSPEEALGIVVDALPTALSCDLVYLALRGSPPAERAIVRGAQVTEAELGALAAAIGRGAGDCVRVLPGAGALWCLEAAVPLGGET